MFSPYDVTTRNYNDLKIDSYDFSNEDLRGSSFNRSKVTNTDFSLSNLNQADLRFKKIDDCQFMLANMDECKLNDVDLSTSRIDSAILKDADLRGTRLPDEHKRECLENVRVDHTTIIHLAYFHSLKRHEKENIDSQMPQYRQTSIEKIVLFCLSAHNLLPELVSIIFLNMIHTDHSSIYNFDILYQFVYQERDYWKSIAPFAKDAPDCIELMKKMMPSLVGDANYFDEQWIRIKRIAQAITPKEICHSKKLHALHDAILNNSLDSISASLNNDKKANSNLEILYHIIYHNQDYWKHITPFTRDTPESINQMEKILAAVGRGDLPPDAGWKKIIFITQKSSQSSLFFSEKLPPAIKKLHHAILNDSLSAFKSEIDHELHESHDDMRQCSIQ